MEKKELGDLNRRELVDLVSKIIDDKDAENVNIPTKEEVIAEQEKLGSKARFLKLLGSTISVLVVVAAVAVLISTLFLPVIQVSGDSMEPTLSSGDILVLAKTHDYTHGQLCCLSWQNKLLLKRVIGLPGDSIDIDKQGNVYINGTVLDEPYVTEKCLGECDIELPYTVPEGTLFVMGDRRDSSIDSRSTAIGCVSYDQMIGKVIFRVWSAG